MMGGIEAEIVCFKILFSHYSFTVLVKIEIILALNEVYWHSCVVSLYRLPLNEYPVPGQEGGK